jgi:hypothetical protein
MIRIIESFVALTDSGQEIYVLTIREQGRMDLAEGESYSVPGRSRFELENATAVTPINENTFQIVATGERLTVNVKSMETADCPRPSSINR